MGIKHNTTIQMKTRERLGTCYFAKMDRGHFTGQILNIPGRGRFQIGGWIKGGVASRKVDGGPLEDGPHAYAFALPTSITANPAHGSGAESKRGLDDGSEIIVAIGDAVCIDRIDYRITATANHNIGLIAIPAPHGTTELNHPMRHETEDAILERLCEEERSHVDAAELNFANHNH